MSSPGLAATPLSSTATRLRIDLWTDLGCPWCYIGTHRLRTAIAWSGLKDRVDLVLRSFELDPDTPEEPASVADVLTGTHGATSEDAQRMDQRIQQLATAEGLPFSRERRHANTLTVHRVLQLARRHGVADPFFTALQRGHFAGTLDPFAAQTLVEVATQAGLPEREAADVIAGEAFADEVRRDEAEARALGVTGVPFTVFDRRFAVSGAQSVEVDVSALQQAFGDRARRATRGDIRIAGKDGRWNSASTHSAS